jgi:hypothetical protein
MARVKPMTPCLLNRPSSAVRLVPPKDPKSSTTPDTIYTFRSAEDGRHPVAGLAFDQTGALYGTCWTGPQTAGQPADYRGIIFRLTPPTNGQSEWSRTVCTEPRTRSLMLGCSSTTQARSTAPVPNSRATGVIRERSTNWRRNLGPESGSGRQSISSRDRTASCLKGRS